MTDFIDTLATQFQLPFANPVLVFSLILMIILLVPIALNRIKIPGIIGLILAGVIIGPHGFNLLERNSAVDLFSTIGLLYIMFIAGLELDLAQFRANRNKSLLFALFTFMIPFALGIPAMLYGLKYDLNASLLTASMFATHTLVAYPIVSQMRVTKNEAVAITVGGTILTDTAVLILLAVILGNNEGGLTKEFWIMLFTAFVVFLAIMFWLIPKIAGWFFEKFPDDKHLHYVFVLSTVFFAAFLAEVAGIEPIIGAFFAGLALNKIIPKASALMNRVEFIGNSLFIPFFLISVGMLVDVRVIFSGPQALIIAGVLTVVAMAGKWLAAWFTQLLFSYSKGQRNIIFGLSSAHAAATLAVVMVGYQAQILDKNILNGTIILILIASIVATFVTEKAATVVAEEDKSNVEQLIKSSGASEEQILIAPDHLRNLESLLNLGIAIKEQKSPLPLSVLSVVSNDEEAEQNMVHAKAKIESICSQPNQEDLDIKAITTIDPNKTAGVARISREIMTDIILTDWTLSDDSSATALKRKLNAYHHFISKTLFVSDLKVSVEKLERVVLIAIPGAEEEQGFETWSLKIMELAEENNLIIDAFCSDKTSIRLQTLHAEQKFKSSLEVKPFNFIAGAEVLKNELQKNDLVVYVNSRPGGFSYNPAIKDLPYKIKELPEVENMLLIYPEQKIKKPEPEENVSLVRKFEEEVLQLFRRK